jgi:hypothetical protein
LKVFKIDAKYSPAETNSGEGVLNLDVKFNDQTFNYVSKVVRTDNAGRFESLKAESTMKTNMAQLGFAERKSNLEIIVTDKKRVTLKYQQEYDGKKSLDFNVVATQERGSLIEAGKYRLRSTLFWPKLLGSQDALKNSFEVDFVPNKYGTFKFSYEFGKQNVKAKFEATWKKKNRERKILVSLKVKPTNMPPMVPKIDALFVSERGRHVIKENANMRTHKFTSTVNLKVNDLEIISGTLERNDEKTWNGYYLLSKIVLDATVMGKMKKKVEFEFT